MDDKLTLNQIRNETWNWKGKEVKLGYMNIGQLEQCLSFIKSGKVKNNIFGKSKEHWKDVFNHMIKYKSDDSINYIIKQQNEHRIRVITNQINKLTINQTTLR